MNRAILAGAGVLAFALAAQPAAAADMPVISPVAKAPVAAPPPPVWAGFYGGLAAGYSWGRTDVDYEQDPAFYSVNEATRRFRYDGFVGGGQLGYNFQSGVWVYGIEADIAWREETNNSFLTFGCCGDTLTVDSGRKWFGTVRGRFGVTPTPASLAYLTAGLAFGRFEHSVSQFCGGGCGVLRSFSNSRTKTGWAMGGGFEVALNRNWSLAAEYLYLDFSAKLTAPAEGPFGAATATFDDSNHIVWAKLNYRPAP